MDHLKQLSSGEDPMYHPRSERSHLLDPARTLTNYNNSTIQPTENVPVIQTYRWRWVVLFVFSLNPIMINIIWIPSAPIANVVSCFYDVSLSWVNALSEVYMLVYVLLLFPVIWILDKHGLRLSMTVGAGCNAAGAALRLAGSGESYSGKLTLY